MSRVNPITPVLKTIVRKEFRLLWSGTHGAAHWARVLRNGRAIAQRCGASVRVAELFAFLHDARRWDEHEDRQHGSRSAQLAMELGATTLGISQEEVELLAFACRHHSEGFTEADATVQACWDADRLDLWRVGTRPDPDRLCTPAARQLLRAQPPSFFRNGTLRI
jgi:uncharacterized protein